MQSHLWDHLVFEWHTPRRVPEDNAGLGTDVDRVQASHQCRSRGTADRLNVVVGKCNPLVRQAVNVGRKQPTAFVRETQLIILTTIQKSIKHHKRSRPLKSA